MCIPVFENTYQYKFNADSHGYTDLQLIAYLSSIMECVCFQPAVGTSLLRTPLRPHNVSLNYRGVLLSEDD